MTDIHFKIIIPFYNVEKWIKYPLKTVLLQEYKNFECILVNDISTDNTIAIAKEVIKDDKRFKILNKDKKTEEEKPAEKKKASEDFVDASTLEDVETAEDVNLSVGGETESQTDSTRAELIEFVCARLGKKLNKGE